jgi:hypothetical protein
MYRYLPRSWRLRLAGGAALPFLLVAGLPLMFSVALVLGAKLWPVLLLLAIVVLVGRILAR